MKTKGSQLSRRRFIAFGSVGLASVWAAYSDQLGGQAVRDIYADARREVLKPQHVPACQGWNPNSITAAWLGHSTVLVNFYGLNIITDPVLFSRIGARTGFGTVGPKRFVASALKASQLPEIDLVLLSHAHMDHLCGNSLRAIKGKPQAVTAKNTTDLLEGTAVSKTHALAWGDKQTIFTQHGEVRLQAFEVKHWGARWRYDRHRGYNGYILEREGKKIIFGGDTAYIESFRDLRRKGPFELAIMPIGAYQPWVISHCTPEQAVRMTNEAGAKHLLPIHFKTFRLGREGRFEPMERLQEALEPERIGWRDIGQTFRLT